MTSNRQLFVQAALETREETQKALVALARQEHGRVMHTEPRPSRFMRFVDGVQGAPEEKVRADGQIEYRYPRLDEVVTAAMDLLFDLSPVLSGAYRMGHTLFVDGVSARDLSRWDGQGRVMISNFVPYARKIELGKMVMRVPGSDHVYEQAEYLLKRRFGNQARITFTFEGIAGGTVAEGYTAGRRGRGAGLLKNQSNLRYPALLIEER